MTGAQVTEGEIPERHHGGDTSTARRWPGAPSDVLDLSTGINPFSYPIGSLADSSWSRLPQGKAEKALKVSLAMYLGGLDTDTLTLAPGSQILINRLPYLFPPGDVVVVAPTYAEHALCWSRAGHRVTELERWQDGGPGDAFLVLTNPNNPDGRRFSRRELVRVARAKQETGGWLIVDEAFGDLVPGLSLADLVQEYPIIVLRSFGKFFGLAGVRLGALVANPGLCLRMGESLGPWSVCGPALEIATRAYADRAWIDQTRRRLKREAQGLDRLLAGVGLNTIGGTDLFRLVEHTGARRIFEGLGQQGILVRPFPYRADWLRFGLPPDIPSGRRLAETLEGVMRHV